jgi:type II secretory pathway component PulF
MPPPAVSLTRRQRWIVTGVCLLSLLFSIQLFALGMAAPTFYEMFAEMETELPKVTKFSIKMGRLWLFISTITGVSPMVVFVLNKFSKATLRFGVLNLLVSFSLVVFVIVAYSLPIIQMASVENH